MEQARESRQLEAQHNSQKEPEATEREQRTNEQEQRQAREAESGPNEKIDLERQPEQVEEAEARPTEEARADSEPDATVSPEPEPEPTVEPEPEAETAPESEPKPQPEPEPGKSEAKETEKVTESEPEPIKPQKRPAIQRGGTLLEGSPPPPAPIPPPRQTSSTASSSDPKPDPDTLPYEPGELLLVSADMAEAQRAAQQLRRFQVRVKSRSRLDNLGLVISVFRLPPDADASALATRLGTELPDLNLDTNQRYQLLSGRRQFGQRLIGWPESTGACARKFRIGMLDTPVAEQHPALVDTALVKRNFVRGESAAPVHGTAVASLLIGEPGSLAPGLLPGSQLFAAEVFRQRGDTTDTSTETLLAALDWLVSQKVQAINLSLGGERNRVFELALEQLMERGISLVAAAGNQGPDAPPVFPAAQQGVTAVTAVDAAEQLYHRANRGDYVDFAAPGVDIWAADGDVGGIYHSGTSFAVPFVTAAMLSAEQQTVDLTQGVKDLGSKGRDESFGWGLVQIDSGCQ